MLAAAMKKRRDTVGREREGEGVSKHFLLHHTVRVRHLSSEVDTGVEICVVRSCRCFDCDGLYA